MRALAICLVATCFVLSCFASTVRFTREAKSYKEKAGDRYAFTCDPQHYYVDVELGKQGNASTRQAHLTANLKHSQETLSCAFRIFISPDRTGPVNSVVFFRLGNLTVVGETCEDAAINLFDVDDKYEKSAQLERYCSSTSKAYGTMKTVSSTGPAMIIEISARSPYTLDFDADVFELPTPCPFFCASDARCIAVKQRCDRFVDCSDGSDENGCEYADPSEEEHTEPLTFVENEENEDRAVAGTIIDDLTSDFDMADAEGSSLEVEEDMDDRSATFYDTPTTNYGWDGLDDRISYNLGGADSGCGSLKAQKGMSSSFTSMNYPCPYGPRLRCNWDISVPPGNGIVIGFNTKLFFIEPGLRLPPPNHKKKVPCADSLNFYVRRSDTPGSEEVLIKSICGVSKAPAPFYIRANQVRVEFKSDDRVDGYGFRLFWAAATPDKLKIGKPAKKEKPKAPAAPKKEQSRLGAMTAGTTSAGTAAGGKVPQGAARPALRLKSMACAPNTRGDILTKPSGSFGSPRFAKGNYTYGANCTWVISGGANQIVVLFFAEFALEPSPDCSFDVVNIWDGTEQVGKYCGQAFIPPLKSRTNKVMVTFASDNKVEDTGFRVFYHVIDADKYNDLANRMKPRAPLRTTTTAAPRRPPPERPGVPSDEKRISLGDDKHETVDYSTADDEWHRGGKIKRVSASKCGHVNGSSWGASFDDTCHGVLIHGRWLLATSNCLEIQGQDTLSAKQDAELNFAHVFDWTSLKSIGMVQEISIKSFDFNAESNGTLPITGLALIQFANPVKSHQKTPSLVCLPSNDNDDDNPDASCEFPASPAAPSALMYQKNKIPNDKCLDILSNTRDSGLSPEHYHIFECFLLQDVKKDEEDGVLSSASKLAVQSHYSAILDKSQRSDLFNYVPLKFCQNFDETWNINGVLVQVLESESDDAKKQTVAVYVRVSHFFEWIFTIAGNAGSTDNKLITIDTDL